MSNVLFCDPSKIGKFNKPVTLQNVLDSMLNFECDAEHVSKKELTLIRVREHPSKTLGFGELPYWPEGRTTFTLEDGKIKAENHVYKRDLSNVE